MWPRLTGGKCRSSSSTSRYREVMLKWLVMLFNVLWRVGVAPTDWRKAQIIFIYKKVSRLECSNCRGMSLLSVVGKV